MKGVLAALSCAMLLLAACSPREPLPVREEVEALPSGEDALARAARQSALDSYKREFARRIVRSGAAVFSDPLPEEMKSIVVLDITIAPSGYPTQVLVYRSNGFVQLEQRALDSVLQAAPFAAPGVAPVNFLETFLFRDDGRFQIRSLVAAPQPSPLVLQQ